jgi:hypothetical protein
MVTKDEILQIFLAMLIKATFGNAVFMRVHRFRYGGTTNDFSPISCLVMNIIFCDHKSF